MMHRYSDKQREELYKEVLSAMTERSFLKEAGLSSKETMEIIDAACQRGWINALLGAADERGRFQTTKVVEVSSEILDSFGSAPEGGWAVYAYGYVLGRLFPEKKLATDDEAYRKGRVFYLQLLKALFCIERECLEFDPTVDMIFPRPSEVEAAGGHKEYRKFERMMRKECIYEFMRIGIEISPWNTLGHIAGVHYVAMHTARQLAELGAPVDLGLVSGSAAGHDLGKYGCKKSEERRIPYLHYYYTDLCFDRFQMPMIGHIAANHSTWDLELENLAVESLILIYSDFRVKSSRVDGREIVHFYTLKESFDVILSKLDNVDEAKKLRYQRVYNKLVDFENYMKDLGVQVDLPETAQAIPGTPVCRVKKDMALIRNQEVVEEMKHVAVDHNIRLMNKFYQEEEFASLLETARSEKQWRNLRTYISIFGAYSTYMTEKQKLLTLKFLYELLAHRESDIRDQAGVIIGQIIARFNVEYKKELPEGVHLAKKKVTNLSLWTEYVDLALQPDYKMTEQHKKWIGNSLRNMLVGLFRNCKEGQKEDYIAALIPWFRSKSLTAQNKEALLRAADVIMPQWCSEKQRKEILLFAKKMLKREAIELRIAALEVHSRYAGASVRDLSMGDPSVPESYFGELTEDALSEMFLDNLKAKTPWTIKIANIKQMLNQLKQNPDNEGQVLHVATHLGNLVKVSETVAVRRAAGNGLVSIIGYMPMEQRNEIAVELGKGLEIGDYQFSKYIPDYLGVIMLHLPPQELDELILDLEKLLIANNGQVAAAVLHTFGVTLENYRIYSENFGEEEEKSQTEKRRYRLVDLILRGCANYNSMISAEALWTIGTHVFGSEHLGLEEKYEIFCRCGKKILTLYNGQKEEGLDFFNNAAVLNHIYRFITQYEVEIGDFKIPERKKVAFFPGTFDPFSLSHKAIAVEIRNMGCEVYLALDEFSWSKKTQPRLLRRKIMSMSVADEADIYIFPDDIPVNIANPKDLAKLKEIFSDRELFFVAGSDVIENASCYRAEPQQNSIHTLNHIVFKRTTGDTSLSAAPVTVCQGKETLAKEGYPISGDIVNLHLEEYYEDISSTRIRENIDLNRDISNLIDPVAQNFIYEMGLYLREPAYKHMIQARDIRLETYESRGCNAAEDMKDELIDWGFDYEEVKSYLGREGVQTVRIRDGMRGDKVVALAAVSRLDSIDLLSEFQDQDIAAYIRSQATGAIAVIGGLYYSKRSSISNLGQTILTEVLSELLARDYTYVVYHPCHSAGMSSRVLELIEKQGFINIAGRGMKQMKPIYAVNMKSPVIIFRNMETVIKSPLNKNQRVMKAVDDAHYKMLKVLTRLYPGELILSYNAGIMHHKMISRITQLNGVPAAPREKKQYGPFMAVPFGKVLGGVVVPNTVTKTLHTEKYFSADISQFQIAESSHYSSLENQVRTIKSFKRPVILVDDLLHKGYRMKELDPILKSNEVDVVKTVVGVQTGRGRDLMTVKQRSVDSAYFLPNLKCWIDEVTAYPYLGGDSIKDKQVEVASMEQIPSLNMILPYAVPTFLVDVSMANLYEYSMTCLENAHDILKVLEEEYQAEFERKLTLKRLGEVITMPKRPDLGSFVLYDESVAASAYVEKDRERLIRMRKLFK